jgi:hypothetical protein
LDLLYSTNDPCLADLRLKNISDQNHAPRREFCYNTWLLHKIVRKPEQEKTARGCALNKKTFHKISKDIQD